MASLLVGGCSAQAQENEPAADDQKAQGAAGKSVTVFPIVVKPGKDMGPEMQKRLAAVVGLFLEKAGLTEIELSKTGFDAPKTEDSREIAAALGKFVREKPIKTEYVLYAEIHGTPKTGPQEIRTIVVDKQGRVSLAARDIPLTYPLTSRVRPKNPMTCCLFVAKKLQKLWKLEDPLRADAPQGKMAEYWRKQSAVPPKAEFAAMKQRCQALKQAGNKATCTVYPVRLLEKTNKDLAAALAKMLNEQELCKAAVADRDPKLQIPGDPNEQKVLWDTARAFQGFLKKHPPETDYALFADYGAGRLPSGQFKVGHVHFIVCDRAADWVIVDFQNSHHADFQSVGPKSEDDCNKLVAKRLKGYLSD